MVCLVMKLSSLLLDFVFLSAGSNRPFCDHNIVLFDHPDNGYNWTAYKCLVFYFFVKRRLPDKMKCAWQFPLDIFGLARQYLLVVGFIKAVHISFDGFLVFGHVLSPFPVMKAFNDLRAKRLTRQGLVSTLEKALLIGAT